jgi:hypothetical protein
VLSLNPEPHHRATSQDERTVARVRHEIAVDMQNQGGEGGSATIASIGISYCAIVKSTVMLQKNGRCASILFNISN